MSTRLLILTLLVILMIGGLLIGMFSGSIESALTLPMMQQHTTATQPTMTQAKNQASPTTQTQMPTNIVAQDTFQRKNQALWGTASDARPWDGDANAPGKQNIFTIVNAAGQIANARGNFNALLGGTNTNINVTATGTVNHFANGANFGVILRWSDVNNWYKALIDGKLLRIIRNVQGQQTTISAQPFQAQGGTAYTLRFQAMGPMLFVKVWPAGTAEPAHWMITLMDNALTSGQAGIRVVLRQGTIITITAFQAVTASNSM